MRICVIVFFFQWHKILFVTWSIDPRAPRLEVGLFNRFLLQVSLKSLLYRSLLQVSFIDLFYKSLLQVSLIGLFDMSLLQVSCVGLIYRSFVQVPLIGIFSRSLFLDVGRLSQILISFNMLLECAVQRVKKKMKQLFDSSLFLVIRLFSFIQVSCDMLCVHVAACGKKEFEKNIFTGLFSQMQVPFSICKFRVTCYGVLPTATDLEK